MTHRSKLGWVVLLYFIEGLPFGVFYDALPVYFRTHGVSLRDIGYMSLLQLPWTLKVFWSPLVERLGTPKRWILAVLLVLGLTQLAIPWFDAAHPPAALWVVLGLLTMASATQDVAIDGLFVRLMGPGEEGVGNGVRVTAYRAALIVGGGGTVMLSGVLPWGWIFAGVAGLCAALALALSRMPPLAAVPDTSLRDWGVGMVRWLRRPGAVGVFGFILLYKLGDSAMGAMVRPFWVDRGMRPEEIGLITTTVGIGVTVLGALLGGWYCSKRGIFTALWVLGLAQALSNLGYAGVAYLDAGRLALYGASVLESFTAGLGTASLLAFLTRACEREHAVTQYAVLSAIFGLTRSLAGAASGWATEMLGFADYFALTFVLSLPAYGFLPWVRRWLQGESHAAVASPA